MKQFSTVFWFEFLSYLKRKSYIIVTIVLMAAVAIALSIPLLQGMFAPGAGDTPEETRVAFTDQTGDTGSIDYYNEAFEGTGTEFVPVTATEEELDQMVDAEEYDSAVIITGPLAYTRYVRTIGIYDMFDDRFQSAMKDKYAADTLVNLGVPQQEITKIGNAQVVPNVRTTESGVDQTQSFFYTYILIFVLYMAIIIYGQFVASSVATEKSTRAMELLITSANPRSLIFGKVIGTGAAGLLQFALILGMGYVMYNVNAAYYVANPIVQSIFAMPLDMLLYTVLFFILGFYIYAFLFAAMGSLVSRMEDLATTTQPIVLLFVAAFIVVMFSMGSGNIDNPLMIACSFIPLTSPMAMFTRIALGNVQGWEILLSVAILIVSAWGIGILATGIYRLGVLLYGNPPKPKEIVRMLKNSKA